MNVFTKICIIKGRKRKCNKPKNQSSLVEQSRKRKIPFTKTSRPEAEEKRLQRTRQEICWSMSVLRSAIPLVPRAPRPTFSFILNSEFYMVASVRSSSTVWTQKRLVVEFKAAKGKFLAARHGVLYKTLQQPETVQLCVTWKPFDTRDETEIKL